MVYYTEFSEPACLVLYQQEKETTGMKVYVHLEQRAPEFTLLYQPEHTAKISDLIEV